MTSKELVKNCIEFKGIDRLPVYRFNREIEKSDIVSFSLPAAANFTPQNPNQSEWGFTWERLDDTMGQPKDIVLHDWSFLEQYTPPDGRDSSRLRGLSAFTNTYRDKFIVAGLGITGFGIMTFLRGFENLMEDLYLEPDNVARLCDTVFGFEEDVIRQLIDTEVDAVAFYDDWGMQQTLMISPDMWRTVFKPRYARQFRLIRDAGKKVYFHSCGYIYDIIPDLIEIGADVLNLNQPDVMGIERLASFCGEVCFNCPVDLQKVAITAGREQIYAYTERLVQNLGTALGGFIGYVEEYHSIGLSEENYGHMLQALLEYRV